DAKNKQALQSVIPLIVLESSSQGQTPSLTLNTVKKQFKTILQPFYREDPDIVEMLTANLIAIDLLGEPSKESGISRLEDLKEELLSSQKSRIDDAVSLGMPLTARLKAQTSSLIAVIKQKALSSLRDCKSLEALEDVCNLEREVLKKLKKLNVGGAYTAMQTISTTKSRCRKAIESKLRQKEEEAVWSLFSKISEELVRLHDELSEGTSNFSDAILQDVKHQITENQNIHETLKNDLHQQAKTALEDYTFWMLAREVEELTKAVRDGDLPSKRSELQSKIESSEIESRLKDLLRKHLDHACGEEKVVFDSMEEQKAEMESFRHLVRKSATEKVKNKDYDFSAEAKKNLMGKQGKSLRRSVSSEYVQSEVNFILESAGVRLQQAKRLNDMSFNRDQLKERHALIVKTHDALNRFESQVEQSVSEETFLSPSCEELRRLEEEIKGSDKTMALDFLVEEIAKKIDDAEKYIKSAKLDNDERSLRDDLDQWGEKVEKKCLYWS
ncbi:hypothetical protein GUITHDRAFT_149669, partial [Guillardia theta CCMP2712]